MISIYYLFESTKVTLKKIAPYALGAGWLASLAYLGHNVAHPETHHNVEPPHPVPEKHQDVPESKLDHPEKLPDLKIPKESPNQPGFIPHGVPYEPKRPREYKL